VQYGVQRAELRSGRGVRIAERPVMVGGVDWTGVELVEVGVVEVVVVQTSVGEARTRLHLKGAEEGGVDTGTTMMVRFSACRCLHVRRR
jgi:hypothetical protein